MPRKTKAKSRLDKYYNLAKEQGYRSRAAFKLFQLNRKYNLLNRATTVVDLCAAPGGWMQVCSQVMPSGSTIIGLDLVKIKPVPGCKGFQMDITTPECVQLLKKELINEQADVFLHDGAPNVGGSWAKDAYNQNDLVLSSLKLATQFLKKGGCFVTKVFRSADYHSLIWVFNKFFSKVEATKPLASRFVSAEIFVVCLDYLAPQYIDEKLFDSKYVFQDTEADVHARQLQQELTSIDKVLQKRGQRHRGGYDDDVHQIMYQALPFTKFIESENPYPIFINSASISMNQEEKDKYLSLTKPPADYQILLDDIKVLGKREMLQLLKWRNKIKISLSKQARQQKAQENQQEENNEEENNEEEENQIENEEEQENQEKNEKYWDTLVDKQQQQIEKQELLSQKQELKDQRKQKVKLDNREKKLVGATKGGIQLEDDQEFIDFSKHKELLNCGFQELDNEGKQDHKKTRTQLKYKNQEQLDKNLELLYESKKQRQERGQEKARQKRQLRKGMQDDDDEDNEVDEEEVACKPFKKQQSQQISLNQMKSKFFQKEEFQNLKESIKQNQELTFDNPLNQQKTNTQKKIEKKEDKKPQRRQNNLFESDESEEDDQKILEKQQKKTQRQVEDELEAMLGRGKHNMYENQQYKVISQEPFENEDEKVKQYELNLPISEMEKRRRKLKKLAEKEERKLKKAKGEDNAEFEVVKTKKVEDYEIDDLATNLALAKKMLRKKTREQIINDSFGRDRFEDHDELPKWFTEDENKHVYKINPITKEEFDAEKQKLFEINSRVPKKIMEAKIRKWKKAQKQLKKASKKASQILDTEGINEKTKVKQIQRLYTKEKSKMKKEQEKRYIVGKRGQATGKSKKSKTSVFVDKRLKKDKRATKRIAKSKKNRYVHRHKGKKAKN